MLQGRPLRKRSGWSEGIAGSSKSPNELGHHLPPFDAVRRRFSPVADLQALRFAGSLTRIPVSADARR
jgi:hypothetical protein